MRNVVTLWTVLLGAAALSCNSAHTAGSTETGNPPVIDVTKVALEVDGYIGHVVGERGAVTPGATVVVEVLGDPGGPNSKVEVTANRDGSFDVELMSATEYMIVEVRVGPSDNRSAPVVVTTSGATAGSEDGGGLSCMQRTTIAQQVIAAAIDAGNHCVRDQDCYRVSSETVCTATCDDAITGRSTIPVVEVAVRNVDTNLCADFEADGCEKIIPPCIPPQMGTLKCVNERCELQVESSAP